MFSNWLYHFCKYYVQKTEGFSYEFEKNGEAGLLQRISDVEINTVFDVGANVGNWARSVAQVFPEAVIHAFEISAPTLAKLRNSAPDSVVINDFGLSDTDAEIDYKDYGRLQPINTTVINSVFHDNAGSKAKTLKTRVRRGDDYCEEKGIEFIDLLKIDVEGAECKVLFGLESMIRAKAIRIIQFEYGYTSADLHFLMRDYFTFFEERGYKVGVLRHGGVRFNPWNYYMNDFSSGPNYVAVRNEDAEIQKLISA